MRESRPAATWYKAVEALRRAANEDFHNSLNSLSLGLWRRESRFSETDFEAIILLCNRQHRIQKRPLDTSIKKRFGGKTLVQILRMLRKMASRTGVEPMSPP
jgi:hypothetical protein